MDKYSKEPIDWDSYKEHIWVWYMVDNKSLSDILEILKQDGVVATKQQLEFRLKKWRIFKTIKTQEARWMAKQLDISSSTGEPIVFVKSGKILPESQVAQAVKRHAPLPSFARKFNADSDAQLRFSPTDLIACSPGPAGFYARDFEPWGFHSTLPWIRFRCALLDGSFRIQIRGNTQSSMPSDHLLPMTFASQSPKNQSLEVCKFASNISHIMPEVYTGEHIRRICGIAKAQPSLTIDLLEILIFQLSNNFLDWDFNSEHIVHLMGAFGFDNSRTIRFLFEAAADQPTILAVLDKFWRAAYKTSSTTLTSIIFAEYLRSYDGSDEFGWEMTSVLKRAVDTENLDLAKVILSGPKSTHVTEALSVHGTYFLDCCSISRNHEFALEMAALLLERYDLLLEIINETAPNRCKGFRDETHVISHALASGNIRLARYFVGAGLKILYHCDNWVLPQAGYATRGIGGYESRSIIDHQTIFTAAVVPHVLLIDTGPIEFSYVGKVRFSNRAESENMTLENYLGLSEMLSEIGKLPEWLEKASSSIQSPDLDVVVLAALYGYDALLQTFMHSPGSLNQQNSEGIWPLSAAALGDNVSTCRLLVRMGADPNYVPSFGNWPTPLHHAVYHDSAHLVEVLLDFGAYIDHPSSFLIHATHKKCLKAHRGLISALALSIGLSHWKTAFLLVHRGAEIDSLAFDLAIQSGNSAMMDLLLSKESFQCILFRRIIEKNDDAALQIIPENPDAANCVMPSRLKAQKITYEILLKAVSSGSLSLVSRLLRMKAFRSDHHSLQGALTCSLERGFEEISRELVHAGAKLSQHDLALSFETCTLNGIREFIASSHYSLFSSVGRGLQEFILEHVLLNNTPAVVQFVLETFPRAYSSGALSAAVLRAAEADFLHSREPMNELLLRRSKIDSEQLDPVLENTAVAIAILCQAPAVVLESLLQRSWPEIPAICHVMWIWKALNIACCHKYLREVFLARQNLQIISYENGFHDAIWHIKPKHIGVKLILPLSLAIDLRNGQVCTKLMAKGFLADRRTIEAAIRAHTSLDVLKRILSGCKEGHDIIRLWDDILHFALECKNDQAMRHLIHNGANLSAVAHTIANPRSSTSVGTLLQKAVMDCRSTHGRLLVQLLLDAGANVNEPIQTLHGATALQAAAGNGHLDLVRKFITLGADINARRALAYGFTCLEAAARNGRLDVTQFLLDAGVKTTGREQLQYVRAVKLAEKHGHAAVAQILRRHRPWDESDESLSREKGITLAHVLHPMEYNTEEILHAADQIWSTCRCDWEEIWPDINLLGKDGTRLADDISRIRRSAEANGSSPVYKDLVVVSSSQLAFDILDDVSPSSDESEADSFSSQMVVSNPTSDYSMPLHTSFTQLQYDPDFHERIYEMETD